MTMAEAIKELREMKTDPWTDTRQMEAIDEGIKAIKAIEDIKAEIAEHRNWHFEHGQEDCAMLLDLEALAIIDKHIGGNADE